MHERSGGVPRRVHEAASEILLGAPADARQDWNELREAWIGPSLDELLGGIEEPEEPKDPDEDPSDLAV